MVTVFGQEDVRAQAEEIGIDSYLLKPSLLRPLFDTLVSCLAMLVRTLMRSRLQDQCNFSRRHGIPDSASREQ